MSPDPAALAILHARCFETPRPWTRTEFGNLLADTKTIFAGEENGFALGRVVLDEAELLTIAVAPEKRQAGVGNMLLSGFESAAFGMDARTCFLEVAANNRAAIALYTTNNYTESGRRRGYYAQKNAPAVDAILLSKPLNAPEIGGN